MSKSTYTKNKTLDHRYGGPDYARPATIYVALFTSAPGVSGGGTEVSGGSYARAAVTNNATNWPAAASGEKSNGAAVTFAQATAGWGTVTHFGFFDALSGGNLLDFAPLQASKTIQNGDTPSFGIGSLVLRES